MDRRRGRLKIVRAFADPELGREGFTFETDTGELGAVHFDNVPSVHASFRIRSLSASSQPRL